jgi:carboxyl-terminal processing protease
MPIGESKMKRFILIFTLIFVQSLLGGCQTREVTHRAVEENKLDYITVFAETLRQIQKNYIEKPNVKDLTFNAVEGIKEEFTRRGYKTNELELDWESIDDDDIESSCRLFAMAYDFYIGNTDVPPNELVDVSRKRLVESLDDPHSSFMSKEKQQELLIEAKRNFTGVGVEITIRENVLTVVSPIEGAPAYKAGVKAGDKIIEIDNKPTIDMTLTDAVKSLRGPKGSNVKLTIIHKGIDKRLELNITRDVLLLKSARHKLLAPDIGYVRISSFQSKTDKDLASALEKIENGRVLKGLILDVRNNPGGLLTPAIKVSDLFLDSGLIVSTKGRNESQDMEVPAQRNEKQRNYPIIVLVNGASAGAAEIVAAALQENQRALILGTTTFGLGSIQTILPLSDGASLRLTTAKYYTPSGRSFDGGFQPDVIVKEREGDDAQLIAAKTALQKAADLAPETAIKGMIEFLRSSGLVESE